MNTVTLIGNVGKDPEIRLTQGGTQVASFSLATTERWKANGEKREETSWHNLVVWGSLCKVVEGYVEKGSRIAIMGSIRYESWEDKNTREKKYRTVIKVDKLELLGSPSSRGSRSREDDSDSGYRDEEEPRGFKGRTIAEAGGGAYEPQEDDIPF